MRAAFLAMIAAGGLAGATAASAEPTTGTVAFRATATLSDGSTADRLFKVTLDADSDGDGVGDEAWLRVACSGGAIAGAQVHRVKAPRDVATGQSSGKRMHKPFTIIREWDRSSVKGPGTLQWDLGVAKGARTGNWDIKRNPGKRVAAGGKTMSADDWHAVVVHPGKTEICD